MGIFPGPDEFDLRGRDTNEPLCLTPSNEMDLRAAYASKISPKGQVALAFGRFDLSWQADVLKQVPQEDMSQSLGFASVMKHQKTGGLGIEMFSLVMS